MKEVSIKYQGFHPSDFARDFISHNLEEIGTEAPNGALVNATFNRKDRMIKGIVSVTSHLGRVFAVASGTRLRDVNRKLLDQVRRQVKKWKSKKYIRHNYMRQSHKREAFHGT